MSNVTLKIAGRRYTIACDPGEEAHVSALGRTIEEKVESLPSIAGQSEARTLLFAALLLADELHEARSASPGGDASDKAGMPEMLEGLAGRLESLADRVEGARSST